MPWIEFAPLRIPLHRRIETTAVILFYYSFYFGALAGTCIIVGLFFTSYYPLAVLYLTWAYIFDSGTPSHGGRRAEFVRRLKIWKYFRNYFPIKLVKTVDLNPEKNYIFGYHPHGILCAGAFCNFATEATDFSTIFPGIVPHLLPLMGKRSLCLSLTVPTQYYRKLFGSASKRGFASKYYNLQCFCNKYTYKYFYFLLRKDFVYISLLATQIMISQNLA